jgi:predicted phosphate transport protein (TIGR00153 family)
VRPLFSLFRKSPFGSLAQHAERVRAAVVLIRPLFDAFLAGDREETARIYERIAHLEHEADLLKTDIRDHLPKSLLMPVDRGDVLLFLKEQDRLADGAEDLGVLLMMRATPAPATMKAAVDALVTVVLECAMEWFRATAELPTLEEASYAGPEVDRLMERIRRVSRLETEADERQAEAVTVLFAHEDDLGAVSVVLWMQIFRTLAAVADHAENTADFLRVMLAKR